MELYDGGSLGTAHPRPATLPTLRQDCAIMEDKKDTKEERVLSILSFFFFFFCSWLVSGQLDCLEEEKAS